MCDESFRTLPILQNFPRLLAKSSFEKYGEFGRPDRLASTLQLCLRIDTHTLVIAHPFSAIPALFIGGCEKRKWWEYYGWDFLCHHDDSLLEPMWRFDREQLAIFYFGSLGVRIFNKMRVCYALQRSTRDRGS